MSSFSSGWKKTSNNNNKKKKKKNKIGQITQSYDDNKAAI